MEVEINILELASELAHDRVIEHFEQYTTDEDVLDKLINVWDEDCSTYTEDAQDVFNEWYDVYYDKILSVC